MLFTLATVILFYYLCLDLDIKSAFYGSIFLSLFPYFYDQTLFGYIDTPCIILFTFVGVLFSINRLFREGNRYLSLTIFMAFILFISLTWSGYTIIYLTFLVSGMFISLRFKTLILLGVISSVLIGLFYNKFNKIFYLRELGVSEYGSALYSVYIILFLLIVYLIIMNYHALNNNDQFILGGYIFLFILSLFLSRVASFALIFGILTLLLLYKYSTQKIFIALFMILMLFFNGYQIITEYSKVRPMIDRDFEIILNDVDDKLYLTWDMGHTANYFGKDAMCYASPDTCKNFLRDIANGTLNYSGSYYLLLSTDDLDKIKYAGYELSDDSILIRALNTESIANHIFIGVQGKYVLYGGVNSG